MSHNHNWMKVERTIKRDFHYYYIICEICHEVRYPAVQLQKLIDYAKEELFFFVEDWVLLLLYIGKKYIAGVTHYQKMLFLIFMEFIPIYDIPSENPGFYPYKYGPYSDRIDTALDIMINAKLITAKGRKSSNKELFFITNDGSEKSEKLKKKLSVEQQIALYEFRVRWDQTTTKGLIKYVYGRYPKSTIKSKILKKVFPDRTLVRKRG